MNIGLWILQGLLALLFMFAGVAKFVMPAAQMMKGNPLPLWFFYFIGVAEILGAIGLILPSALRIRPSLTPLAACGLVIIMSGATVISLQMGQPAFAPAVIGLVCAFIAYGRWRALPIAPRNS